MERRVRAACDTACASGGGAEVSAVHSGPGTSSACTIPPGRTPTSARPSLPGRERVERGAAVVAEAELEARVVLGRGVEREHRAGEGLSPGAEERLHRDLPRALVSAEDQVEGRRAGQDVLAALGMEPAARGG